MPNDNPDGPFFTLSEGTVEVYPTAGDALSYIEISEVQSGLTRMFDSRGEEYELTPDARRFTVSAAPTGRRDPTWLKAQVLASLAQSPCSGVIWQPQEIAAQTLEELAVTMKECGEWNADRISPTRRLRRAVRRIWSRQ
jgi:hypothetical protein